MIKLAFIVAVLAFIPDGCASYEESLHADAQCLSWDCEYGCGCELFVDRSVPEYDGQSWHERYVEDHCNACPECCTNMADEAVFCTSDVCPGVACPCVEGLDGEWTINATLSFDDSEEP